MRKSCLRARFTLNYISVTRGRGTSEEFLSAKKEREPGVGWERLMLPASEVSKKSGKKAR